VLIGLFGLLVIGLASGLPVAFTFLAINIIGFYFLVGGTEPLSLLVPSAFEALAIFPLIAIPLFILMGEILLRSGVANLAIDAVDVWIGQLPGRLALVAVAAGTVFGAVSGASIAATALLGKTLVPEMDRRGYKPPMSIASVLAAGGLDTLIPPSALAVLLGALAGLSIGEMLIAIIVPGLLLAAIYVIYFVVRAAIQPHLAPAYDRGPIPLSARLSSLRHTVPVIGLIVVVTGLIFFGVATPSEAAALGVVASIGLAAAYRKLSARVTYDAVRATVEITAMIFLIIAGSKAYSQLIAITGAAGGFVEFATHLPLTGLQLVIGMMIVVFFLGCFLDSISIMMITIPIYMPLLKVLGMDPIWFAVAFLMNVQLGAITPPFGVLLIVMQGVQPQLSTAVLYRSIVPIVMLQIAAIGLVIAFPALTSWLPSLMITR